MNEETQPEAHLPKLWSRKDVIRELQRLDNLVNKTAETMKWLPIETAPRNTTKMFVVRAFNVSVGTVKNYASYPYCVWHLNNTFVRWQHSDLFQPTHWCPLPESE